MNARTTALLAAATSFAAIASDVHAQAVRTINNMGTLPTYEQRRPAGRGYEFHTNFA
ncbi:MAG: hypothetical protein ACOYN0_03220 [Phycisphaerales bacterium]